MPKISIVVPIYKTEKYLRRCVESLQRQTVADVEILLVDDGSPDGCPALCDDYARQDSRIRAIHKPNGGLSSARNAGLKAATGEYIGFVDSDDDVEPDMYEKLLATAEQYQVDFVMSDYIRILQNGTTYLKTLQIDPGYYDRQKIRADIFPQLIMGENVDYGPLLSVCLALYRRRFLEENGLWFDEEVRWSEDNIFSAILGYHCNSFYYLKGEGLYHYHNNPGTITTSYRKGAWHVYCTMNRHLHDFFDGVQDYDFTRQLKLHLMYYASSCVSAEIGRTDCTGRKKRQAIAAIVRSPEMRAAAQDFKLPEVTYRFKRSIRLMMEGKADTLYWEGVVVRKVKKWIRRK